MRRIASLAFAVALVPACNPAAPDVPDTGAPDAHVAVDAAVVGCTTDHDCDDGVFCNGMETCSASHCVARMLACDDGIACTTDTCNESARSCNSHAPDADGDGFADAHCIDAHGVPLGTDCNDADPHEFPGNPEICDMLDQDCNPATLGGVDMDGDGAVPDTCCNPQPSGPPLCGQDCNDMNPSISRLATEICDMLDNDCDGLIDENVTLMSWPDVDQDGYGDETATPAVVCLVPSANANTGGDCNDNDRLVHPHETEDCNGIDDDCDGIIDEGTAVACDVAATGTLGMCVAGHCVVTGCTGSRYDCNGIDSDGCEADLCSAASTCGSCGHMCGSGFTFCGGGLCPGATISSALLGHLVDVTGANVANAVITSLDVCPVVTSTTTDSTGMFSMGPMTSAPSTVRIVASGYPTHVQPMSELGPLITSALLTAWEADPDLAAAPSATRPILVIDYGAGSFSTVLNDGTLGPSNSVNGTDVLPGSGPGPAGREIYFQAQPGRTNIGGSFSDGAGCSASCNISLNLNLQAGSVTHVGPFSCSEVCS